MNSESFQLKHKRTVAKNEQNRNVAINDSYLPELSNFIFNLGIGKYHDIQTKQDGSYELLKSYRTNGIKEVNLKEIELIKFKTKSDMNQNLTELFVEFHYFKDSTGNQKVSEKLLTVDEARNVLVQCIVFIATFLSNLTDAREIERITGNPIYDVVVLTYMAMQASNLKREDMINQVPPTMLLMLCSKPKTFNFSQYVFLLQNNFTVPEWIVDFYYDKKAISEIITFKDKDGNQSLEDKIKLITLVQTKTTVRNGIIGRAPREFKSNTIPISINFTPNLLNLMGNVKIDEHQISNSVNPIVDKDQRTNFKSNFSNVMINTPTIKAETKTIKDDKVENIIAQTEEIKEDDYVEKVNEDNDDIIPPNNITNQEDLRNWMNTLTKEELMKYLKPSSGDLPPRVK